MCSCLTPACHLPLCSSAYQGSHRVAHEARHRSASTCILQDEAEVKCLAHVHVRWGMKSELEQRLFRQDQARPVLFLEKALATHSSTVAWKIPWTKEPGGLQSMGSLGVGHHWATSLSLFTFMHWRRKWHPTPVFLPGESQGRGSLVGCRLWGPTESHTTEST